SVLLTAFTVMEMALFGACAQEQIEIFDAHLHYNQEPKPFYSLDQVREVFRRNGIIGIIANSRPNKGTHELADAAWPELKVNPSSGLIACATTYRPGSAIRRSSS
ncbi:MAG TPA: hypothetical protein VKE53_11410, partial [Pseudolabrys sp.]|nr:hypothetical protein [Pseudolabrys sp.]